MSAVEFVCGYVLEYEDRYEGQALHRGDRESCVKVSDAIPAVSVSGETPKQATIVVLPAAEWDEAWA